MAAKLLTVEIAFLLAPMLLVIALFGFSWREVLALRLPTPRGVAGAALLGASAWALVIALVRFFPPPKELAEELAKLGTAGGSSLALTLLLVAVLPAVCEEFFFRGLVFSGLRRVGPVVAVLVSALLFALMHGSIYRLMPTFCLGVLLGYIRLTTGSIAPGIIFHTLNNGIAMALLVRGPAWVGDATGSEALPTWVTASAAVVSAVGLAVLPRSSWKKGASTP
jgi:sodium transport system permease protein